MPDSIERAKKNDRKNIINRRIIIIFSVLLLIAIIVILMCTLFNLKQVEVKFSNYNEELTEDKILTAAEKFKGKNLLFLSEKMVSHEISGVSPYIYDVDMERVFPNKAIFHVTIREELFVINLMDGEEGYKYFIFDKTSVALRKAMINEDNTQLKKRNVLIKGITQSEVAEDGLKIGERLVLKDERKLGYITSVFDSLMSFAEPNKYSPTQIKDFILEVDVSNIKKTVLVTNYGGTSGVKIELDEDMDRVVPQMQLAVGAYTKLTDYQKSYGTIIVYPDKSQSLGFSAVYSPTK